MTTYLLHFVGSRLYPIKRFLRESERLGVNRAVPFSVLHSIKWGDVVLLAEHSKVPVGENEPSAKVKRDIEKSPSTPSSESSDFEGHGDGSSQPTEGIATIFGFFRVTSLVDNLPDKVKNDLMKTLRIVSVSKDPPKLVMRGCGNYTLVGGVVVEDPIAEVAEKIAVACEKAGINVNSCKFFLAGVLELLEQPVVLRGRAFFQGYAKVDLNLDIPKLKRSKKAVIFIEDYNHNWSEKRAKDRVDQHILEDFAEARH